jgi:hypothetical protein
MGRYSRSMNSSHNDEWNGRCGVAKVKVDLKVQVSMSGSLVRMGQECKEECNNVGPHVKRI